VWIYYSAQILFFGAEFTHVYTEAQSPDTKERQRPEELSRASQEPGKPNSKGIAAG